MPSHLTFKVLISLCVVIALGCSDEDSSGQQATDTGSTSGLDDVNTNTATDSQGGDSQDSASTSGGDIDPADTPDTNDPSDIPTSTDTTDTTPPDDADTTPPDDADTADSSDVIICADGLLCGDVCTNTTSNPDHCGACDNACDPQTPLCVNSQCVATCPTDTTQCGDRCADTTRDPDHCGTCDNACPGSESCSDGTCCAFSFTNCNDACVNTLDDPDNCGACGNVCANNQVCSVGVCTNTCQDPLEICDRRCVSIQTDNDHCGGCGNGCNANQGCVNTTCTPRVVLGPDPAKCIGGGPPIFVDTGDASDTCTGDLAEVSFRWALCSCNDVTLGNDILTDGYDSATGPYAPGGLGGGIGANGVYDSGSPTEVFGTLWTTSDAGLSVSGNFSVRQDIYVGGPWQAGGASVLLDGFVEGDINANGASIGGTLHHETGATITGNLTTGATINEDVTVGPACDCATDQAIPIADIVAARATNNDNALIGLDPAQFTNIGSTTRVDIPCGEYYLTGIANDAPLTIVTHGNTALFIDGDINATNPITITLDPTSQLDIFVSGTVCVSNPLTLGSPNYPARLRVYVGGNTGACGQAGEAVRITNQSDISGNIYAPNGEFAVFNELLVYGGVFVGDYSNGNKTTIHFDRGVLEVGGQCPSGCPQGLTNCDGRCVDLDTNPGYCGSCDIACFPGQSCVDGVCVCPDGLTPCNGQCVDLQNDPAHCGACDTLCQTPTPFCTDGLCTGTCPPPLVDCNGACVDLQNDPANCGTCATLCEDPTPICDQGVCVGGCPPPLVDCNGACVDPSSDDLNCGACGNVCPVSTSCVAGFCECPDPLVFCNGQCVDVSQNPDHCGQCGVRCLDPTPTCQDGACVGGGAACSSCRDCNNQACVNGACGQCQTSADCCSPFFCLQGECIIIN